jgi:hypothetical protein
MTPKETGQIMSILNVAYPQFYKNQTDEERQQALKLWSMMFANDDSSLVLAAVQTFIKTDTKGFPPSVGMISEKIRLLTEPEEMSELEAWRLVSLAVSRTQWQHPEKQFNKLPEIIQQTLGSPQTLVNWGKVDEDAFNTVIQSNFMRTYRAKSQKKQEYNALPESVKAVIAGIGQIGDGNG